MPEPGNIDTSIHDIKRVRYSTCLHPLTLDRLKKLKTQLSARGEGRVIDLAVYKLIEAEETKAYGQAD